MKTISFLVVLAAALLAQSTGLDFPSNGQSPANGYVVMNFLNPQNNGLPIWGPGGAGATYIWKYRPRQQAGYYVTMWWSNNGSFLWDGGSSNSYCGGHPYPRGGGGSTTSHDWEIATDRGGDYTNTRAGSRKPVVKDVWYTQALQVTRNFNGTKTLVFYTALPSVADADVIEVKVGADYGEKNPPSPVLLFGDSTWYKDFYGNERLSGILRHIKIFNKRLSQSDILAEAASETLATTEGAANIWYMNVNPRPDDITDKSGKGHHFSWANSNKAALWTEATAAGQKESRALPTASVRVRVDRSTSYVSIVCRSSRQGTVRIVDAQGVLADRFTVTGAMLSRGVLWKAGEKPSGLYLIYVETGEIRENARVLLRH